MKKLLLSTTFLAASVLAAGAQDATSPFRTEVDPAAISASKFIGMRVYASEAAIDADEYPAVQDGWEDIGEINDVILSRDGTVESVLVDIGGFLGAGERQVAVNMSAIRFVSDGGTADDTNDYFLVMQADRAVLEGAPAYEMGAASTDAMTTEPAADETAAAEPTADAATDETAMAEPSADAATEAPAADDTMAATDATREPILRDGYDAMDRTQLTAEALTGAVVYDSNDERVGEVGELVITEDGQITQAVIDVGGFLGIGEKPVALAMDELDILRQQGGNEVRVYLAMTKEQLEGLPVHGG